jgi:5-methylcytosine-specific restriction endonuclease McrA
MPVKVTKKALNDLLVEERKKMRHKAKHHKFMQRTLQMYNSDKQRAKEKGELLSYTLEEFRASASGALSHGFCCYSGEKISVSNMAADHYNPVSRGGEWSLLNLSFCTKQENFRKGSLTGKEYERLKVFIENLPPEAQKDIWTRLTVGGKWMPGR